MAPGEILTQELDVTLMQPVNGAESKAIRIESDVEIQVMIYKIDNHRLNSDFVDAYDVSELQDAGEGEMVHFTSSIDNTACTTRSYTSQFLVVVSFFDNTDVTLTLKNGTVFQATLSAFGTYSLKTGDATETVARGTRINSSAPVNVISGVGCDHTPESAATFISNIPQVDNLAQHYLVPYQLTDTSTIPDSNVQVLATEPDTDVSCQGALRYLEEPGDSTLCYQVRGTKWISVNCSKPCLVTQYTRSEAFLDGSFMLLPLPSRYFYTSTLFTSVNITASQASVASFINVAVEGEGDPSEDLLLNGNRMNWTEWDTLDGFSVGAMPIEPGLYTLESVSGRPIVVYIYSRTSISPGGAGYTRMAGIKREDPPSTPPPYSIPQLSVRVNGTVKAQDGEDITPQCGQVSY